MLGTCISFIALWTCAGLMRSMALPCLQFWATPLTIHAPTGQKGMSDDTFVAERARLRVHLLRCSLQ